MDNKSNPVDQPISGKKASGSDKAEAPKEAGDQARKAQEWGGGSKASKGAISPQDRKNQNSSQRS